MLPSNRHSFKGTSVYSFHQEDFILAASKYKVTVFTGDKPGAGTDANVYITMFGEFGDSGEKKLTSRKNNFERGK